MGHREQIEARLESALMTFPDARTFDQERLAENEKERREAEREEKIADLTREMMRDPGPEALNFVADCNAHMYPELVALCCKAIYAGSDLSRLHAIANISAMLRPQFETCASYKLLERS